MARILFDLSGTRGLAQKYHGDVDGVSNPHLKYQAKDGEFADGIMNPLRRDGFISGYNTAVTKTITGTLIKSFVYDDINDDIYAAGSANLIYRLDTPSDTSYTTVITLDATSDIYDMDLYEVNGYKALVYTSSYSSAEQKVVLGSTTGTKYDTWTRGESIDASFFPDLMTYGEGQFFTGNQGETTIYRSVTGYDGWETWDTFGTGVNMIKYVNDKIIVGGGAAASNFGHTSILYEIATVINDATSDDFEYWDGAYGAGLYVFAGNGPTTTNIITWDGTITFTLRTTDSNPLYGVAWSGSIFAAVGSAGAIFSSTDGITWTVRTAAVANTWTDIAYGGGYFVAIATTGTSRTMYSSNGTSWVTSTALDAIAPRAITYADGYFIVTGATGTYKSTNAVSWTLVDASLYGRCIAYGNGYFVIGSFVSFGSSSDNGASRYPFYVSGTLTDSSSGTPDKASVGFYCLDTDEGLFNLSSTVKKTYPNTYETQRLAWNLADTYISEYTHFRQAISLVDEDDNGKTIEKIRLGLLSYLQEDTVLKVSVFQGDSVSSASTAAYETTITLTATDSPVYKDYFVDFGTQSPLTGANAYIAITLNSIASTTKHGYIEWVVSPPASSLMGYIYGYNGTGWISIGGENSNQRSFDVSVIKSSSPFWTRDYITSAAEIPLTTTTNFIRKAENGFLYWFTDNSVHSIDGTVTGGSKGRFRKNILQFPSYYNIVEAIDYRGRQYIAIQSTSGTQSDLSTNSNWSGVYVWDRLSQVTNFRDFIAVPGIQSFKAFFIDATGSLMLICIGNDKQTQLRKFSGSEFTLVKTMGVDAYPISQRGVGVLNQISYWYGQDGILYGYGSTVPGGTPQLYKLANLEAGVDTAGAVITADNSSSLNNLRIITSFKESTDEGILSYKPFDANATYTAGGEVWTQVQILPSLSTVTYIRGVHIPNSIASPSAATNVATVSCYLNMSPTAAWTKTLTQVDMNRGYWEKEFNKSNVNSIQFKIAWLGQTLATGDYSPMYIDVKITEEARPK